MSVALCVALHRLSLGLAYIGPVQRGENKEDQRDREQVLVELPQRGFLLLRVDVNT